MSLKSAITTASLSAMTMFSAFAQNKDMVSPDLKPADGYHLSVQKSADNTLEATYHKNQNILKLKGIDKNGDGILSSNEIKDVTVFGRLADDMNHISVAQKMPNSDEFLNVTTTQLEKDGQTHSMKRTELHDNFADMVRESPMLKKILPYASAKPNTPKR